MKKLKSMRRFHTKLIDSGNFVLCYKVYSVKPNYEKAILQNLKGIFIRSNKMVYRLINDGNLQGQRVIIKFEPFRKEIVVDIDEKIIDLQNVKFAYLYISEEAKNVQNQINSTYESIQKKKLKKEKKKLLKEEKDKKEYEIFLEFIKNKNKHEILQYDIQKNDQGFAKNKIIHKWLKDNIGKY